MISIKTQALFFLLVLLAFGFPTLAQEDSTDLPEEESTSDTVTIDADYSGIKELNPPSKAALLGAIIPGFGQVYNKQYWKIPIVYGGYVVFASLIDYNQVRYSQFRDALFLTADNNPETVPEGVFANFNADQLRRGRDRFRRDRDFNVILTFMWYGLTIADATVDAHLKNFDVSDNLSASVRPALIPNDANIIAPGISLTLNFK